MATVTFEKAQRWYPGADKPAVPGIDLEIGDGEFMVLVGPSGCGKSTSLRMLAGLEEINEGKIYIGDRDVTHIPPKDRDIAMVFQNYALYPHMSVADNMAFALKMAKVPAGGAQEAGRRGRAGSWAWRSTSSASPRPSPVVSASAWRWVARSCGARRCSAWTSRCRTSTRRCAWPPAPTSPSCRPTSGSPPSTSPTTRSRR